MKKSKSKKIVKNYDDKNSVYLMIFQSMTYDPRLQMSINNVTEGGNFPTREKALIFLNEYIYNRLKQGQKDGHKIDQEVLNKAYETWFSSSISGTEIRDMKDIPPPWFDMEFVKVSKHVDKAEFKANILRIITKYANLIPKNYSIDSAELARSIKKEDPDFQQPDIDWLLLYQETNSGKKFIFFREKENIKIMPVG